MTTIPTVQCEICQLNGVVLKCTSEEANKHTKDTGHEWFSLLIPDNGCEVVCESCEFRDIEQS